MADLITPVIVATFGGTMVLIVLGFLLVRQRSGRPRFESQDYYKTYRRPDRFSQTQSQSRQGQTIQDRKEQRAVLIAVVVFVAASVALAWYEPIEGLLLLFLLPIIVRF